MAYKIIRPRKGKLSEWIANKTRIYKEGEMLVVSPETGVGTGFVGVKFGDGVTNFERLPYAILPPTDELIEGYQGPVSAKAVIEMREELKALINAGSTGNTAESASGSLEVSVPSSSSKEYIVTFDTPLSAIPKVILQSSENYLSAELVTSTKSGFTIKVTNSDSTGNRTGTITWLAEVATNQSGVFYVSYSGSIVNEVRTITTEFPLPFAKIPNVKCSCATVPSITFEVKEVGYNYFVVDVTYPGGPGVDSQAITWVAEVS